MTSLLMTSILPFRGFREILNVPGRYLELVETDGRDYTVYAINKLESNLFSLLLMRHSLEDCFRRL